MKLSPDVTISNTTFEYRFVQSPVSPHYHPCRSTLHALVAAFMPSDTIALPAARNIPQQSLHTCNNRANSFLYNNSSKKTVVFSSNPLFFFFWTATLDQSCAVARCYSLRTTYNSSVLSSVVHLSVVRWWWVQEMLDMEGGRGVRELEI